MTATGVRNRDFLIIAGFILAVTLPFSARAFHLDDNFFLRMGEIIQRHPLSPYAEDPEKGFLYAGLLKVPTNTDPAHSMPSYLNELPERVLKKLKEGTLGFESAVHPPLYPYFTALVARISGGFAERSQHIAYQLFTLLAALTAYALAGRFTRFPLWTTLLFVVSCVFVISAHSLMSDMPMIVFYQAAVWFYVGGIDRADFRRLAASGVFMTMAFLTRYNAATIIPVLLTYGVLKRAPLSRMLLPLAVFLVLYGLWEAPNVLRYGRPHLLASSAVAYDASANYDPSMAEASRSKILNAARNWLERSVGSLVYIGSTMVFPLALLFVFVRGPRVGIAFLALVIGCQILIAHNAWNLFPRYTFIQSLCVALCLATGLLVPVGLAARTLNNLRISGLSAWRQQSDSLFLLFWLLIVLAATVVALPFAAARYLFPLVFPLVALFVNQAAAVFTDARRLTRFFALGFTAMLVLSLNMAFADYQQAGIYRAFVRDRLPAYQAHAPHIWYIAEWGFRHYAEQAGVLFLPPEINAPAEGDLIIIPTGDTPHGMSEALLARVKLIDSVPYYSPTPLRLLDDRVHAGYYSHGWGYLPFSFSWAPAERFEVYQVTGDDYFVRNFSKAERALSEGAVAEIQSATIDGEPRNVIWETPTSRITYRLVVPKDKLLSFGIGLDPSVWSQDKGDGVLFELLIHNAPASDAASAQTLFSKYIDPKNNPEDRKWHPVLIDMSPYSGKEVALTFVTKPGPQDDATEDWAGWVDPKFIAKPTRPREGPP